MASPCLEIYIGTFETEEGGACIPKAVVSTYQDLVTNAYVAFEKDRARYDVDFFRHRRNITSELKAPLWNSGVYFNNLVEEGALQIFARFSERTTGAGRQATPVTSDRTPVSGGRTLTAGDRTPTAGCRSPVARSSEAEPRNDPLIISSTSLKRSRPVHDDPAREHTKQPQLKRTSFASRASDRPATSSSSRNGPSSRHRYSTTPSSANDTTETTYTTDTTDRSESHTPLGGRGSSSHAGSFQHPSNHSACSNIGDASEGGAPLCKCPTPPKPEGTCNIVLPYILETSNMFKKGLKDFSGTSTEDGLDLDDTYDDVRDKIARRLYNSVGSGQVVTLKQYKRQIHFDVCLGTAKHGFFRMERPLRVMHYAEDLKALTGHIHVWLERDGIWFKDRMSATPDHVDSPDWDACWDDLAMENLQVVGSLPRCASLLSVPSPRRGLEPCSPEPVTLRIGFKRNRKDDKDTKCPALDDFFSNIERFSLEFPGHISCEEVLGDVRRVVREYMRDTDVDPAGIWIDFGVFFQADKGQIDNMCLEDPRQTLHQFLEKPPKGPRELHGRVIFRKRKRAPCCDEFNEDVMLECDGKKGCKVKVFHCRCAGLNDLPKSLYWFCDDCLRGEISRSRAQEQSVRNDDTPLA